MRAPDVACNSSKLLGLISSDDVRGSHTSSCDQTSTPRCQKGGWTGTGETGLVRRRGTPAGSCKVVGVDDLAHGQRGGDGWMRLGRREHLCERRAGMWQHSAGRSASRCESVRYCCTCSQAAAVAESEVGAKTSADEVVALARALQMSRFSTAAEHLLGHGGRREL
jgi:hypothetical protein